MMDWLRNEPMLLPKIIATLTFTSVTVWTWFRPRKYIYEGAPNTKRWRDLRIWVTIMMMAMIFLYWYF
jgi:hypothetical protein